jgi:hypothetical protein
MSAMKSQGFNRSALRLLVLAGFCASALQGNGQHEQELVAVSRAQLCITKGAIEAAGGSRLEVTVPEMRAVVAYPTARVAEAKLTYLGPTSKDKPLGSGEIRRQFGLKLRAQNGCNLVYAMWRIAPKPELVVSYKSNPGMSTSAECGTHGYHDLKPTRDLTAPRLKKGQNHTLRAEINGNDMRVLIDGKLSWQGLLDREALAFDGPSGVRTDNGRFKFEFFSSPPASNGENLPCHAADGDE